MITAIDGLQPDLSLGTWEAFLATCELREEHQGTRFYSKVNCNYIVFPNDQLLLNYGYHGHSLMDRVRKEGWRKVVSQIESVRRSLDEFFRS